MTQRYIAFANSRRDWPLINSLYPESAGCRTTLQLILASGPQLPTGAKLWVDCGVDGLHHSRVTDPADAPNPGYRQYVLRFDNSAQIADPQFQRNPDKIKTAAFVNAVLDEAVTTAPDSGWLSVPQLPYSIDSDRNKINKQLAHATGVWKAKAKYRGKLILPVVLAKSGHADKKTGRNPTVSLAASSFESSGASGVWMVDSSLDDQEGVRDFENIRFPGIIKLHEELNQLLPPNTVTVGGPYWGLNLVLWARGLIRFPAIGVGRSYKYYLPGGKQKESSPRVALAPLRRLAVWSPDLKNWLGLILEKLSKSDRAYRDFADLLRNFDLLSDKDHARRQVATFYKEWIEKIEGVKPDGRALTLYQDLSAAYVLGSRLPPLPASEKLRSPGKIAKQLMVNCL